MIDNTSSLYPRTYHKKRGHQIMLVLIVLAIVIAIQLLLKPKGVAFGYLCFFGLIFITLFLNDVFAAIILYEDRILRKDWFGSKELKHNTIIGFHKSPRLSQYMLMTKSEDRNEGILIPSDMNADEMWNAWIAQFQDLETIKEQNLVADVKHHPELGQNHKERDRALRRAIAFSKWLNRITWCGVFSGFIPVIFNYFISYLFIILPWIALYTLYKKTSIYAKLDTATNPLTGNLTTLVISGLCLGWFSVVVPDYQIPISETRHLFLVSVIIAMPLLYLTYQCLKPMHPVLTGLICFIAAFSWESYGVGVIVKMDTQFDHSVPTPYTVKVIERSYSQRGGGSMRVSPWWKENGSLAIAVSYDFYASVKPNGNVCIQLHSGLLGVSWYTMTAGKCG